MNRRLGFGMILATAVAIAAAVAPDRRGERPPVSESGDRPVAKEVSAAGADRSATAHKLSAVSRSGARARSLENEGRVRQRAAALVQDLGLSADDAVALLDVLLQEQDRRQMAFRDLSNAPQDQQASVRAEVRENLDEIRAWKTAELERRFSSDIAGSIMRR